VNDTISSETAPLNSLTLASTSDITLPETDARTLLI